MHILQRAHIIPMAAMVAGLAVSGCHSTQLAATWHEPSAQPMTFQHVVTVFATSDVTYRRVMEDKMAAQFPNGAPSYRVLGSTDVTDANAVREKLSKSGYDGAMIMRVVKVDQAANYVAGSYWNGAPYTTFSGYWGSAWGYPYDPGYYAPDIIVSIETQVYSLKGDDKLVWAARSETTNPESVNKLGDSVLRHVMKAMRKQGIVASTQSSVDTAVGGDDQDDQDR